MTKLEQQTFSHIEDLIDKARGELVQETAADANNKSQSITDEYRHIGRADLALREALRWLQALGEVKP